MKPRQCIEGAILNLSDQGRTPAQIAATVPNVKLGKVYDTLRKERPARPRAPRARTSRLRAQVLALLGQGKGAAEVAREVGVARQYVYRIRSEIG